MLKRLREAYNRLVGNLDAAADTVSEANQKMRSMLGLDEPAINGEPVKELPAEPTAEASPHANGAAAKKGKVRA